MATPLDSKSDLDVKADRFDRPNPDDHRLVLPQGVIVPGFRVMKVRTTDNTPALLEDLQTELEYIEAENYSIYAVKVLLIASQVAGSAGSVGDSFGSFNSAVIKRMADATTTTLVDAVVETSAFADAGAAGWSIAVQANVVAGEGGLEIEVTGEVNKTIDWEAQVYFELGMAIEE